MADAAARTVFDGLERVVADPLRFKSRLRIGEDAYALMRLTKPVQRLWDVGGVAWTGATVAASPVVASTFFASTASGGILSLVGFGTAAATPIGWVAAAALLSGGAYWGVTRLFRGASDAMVDSVPRFINTPLDLLGAGLLDLMGALAMRVATIDGRCDPAESEVIAAHFIEDWGYDPAYASRALALIAAESDTVRVKQLAQALAAFQASNPDCNAAAMQTELLAFLRDIAAADGRLDEREELAIEAVRAVFRAETDLSLRRAGRAVADWSSAARSAAVGLATRVRHRPATG